MNSTGIKVEARATVTIAKPFGLSPFPFAAYRDAGMELTLVRISFSDDCPTFESELVGPAFRAQAPERIWGIAEDLYAGAKCGDRPVETFEITCVGHFEPVTL